MSFSETITAASRAYQTGWMARSYIMRLAMVPVILKLFCFALAITYGSGEGPETYLRFMLIMLPAILAEGWMLSHYVRFLVLGQTWPFRPSGDMEADLQILTIRARGVLSGMIVFALISVVSSILMYGMIVMVSPYLPADPAAAREASAQLPAHIALTFLVAIPALLWGFRLMWLYVPFALNIIPANYLGKLRGYASSLHLILVWVLCVSPFLLLMRAGSVIVIEPLSGVMGEQAGAFLLVVMSVLVDTAKAVICTGGITYVVQAFYERGKGRGAV
ncbi:MAG: hypothetical protein WC989_08465 [Micavibrio sp.]